MSRMHEFDLKDKNETKRLPKPPGKWRTCWQALVDNFHVNNTIYNAGDKFKGQKLWPCRDSAETYGREREKAQPGKIKFLGAESEE